MHYSWYLSIICGINLWWFVVGGDVGCGGAELTPH